MDQEQSTKDHLLVRIAGRLSGLTIIFGAIVALAYVGRLY
jgi:hypothetical protein